MWLADEPKIQKHTFNTVACLVSLKYVLVPVWIRSMGGGTLNMLIILLFQTFLLSSPLPVFCLSLASPTLTVYKGTDDIGIFFEGMWEVCNPFPTWCGLLLPEGKQTNKQTMQSVSSIAGQQLYKVAFEGHGMTLQDDSTQGTGWGLGGPAKLPLYS